MTLVTVLVVVLVVAAGLYLNHRVWRWRPRQAAVPGGGLVAGELAVPLVSIAVLLLVFVLVQTYASWANVGRAENDEATATLLLFREADLVRDARLRERIHKQVFRSGSPEWSGGHDDDGCKEGDRQEEALAHQ